MPTGRSATTCRTSPSLFYYNAICVISDLSSSRAGTITSGLDRFMQWKRKSADQAEDNAAVQFETFYEGMFQKERLLDILQNFILFSGDSQKPAKILAGYHQYFAVRKAVERARQAARTDGKGGVFWHTQGSGKSLSMVFYAHLLQTALDSPTIVVMTDRIDLDDQLYTQFARCAEFLRQTPVQAESKEHLKKLLDGRQANGIIFTTMFKFERGEKPLSERRNIVVMADEAHRGQYGFEEKLVLQENARANRRPAPWWATPASSGRRCPMPPMWALPAPPSRPGTGAPGRCSAITSTSTT